MEETFLFGIVIILILGIYVYITRPANTCHHNWDTTTPVDNDNVVIHEHICNKCGKIESSYYYKTDKT